MLCSGNWKNLCSLKGIITGFELVSGLSVNLSKPKLYDINLKDEFLSTAASLLSCNIGFLPFKFLGIAIGYNLIRGNDWCNILNKLRIKDEGGLGLKHCGTFNMALLSKWLWRMLNDHSPVWFEPLSFRYGNIRSKILDQSYPSFGKKDSLW